MHCLLLLAWTPACTGDCEGVGCASLFTANQLTLRMGGAALDSAPADEGALVVTGTSYHGTGWVPAVFEDSLLVGLPDIGELRPIEAPLDAEASLDIDGDALRSGALLGEVDGDRFGADFALLPQPDGSVDLWVGAPDMQGPGTAVGAGGVYRFVDWGARRSETLDAETEASTRVLSETAADRLGEVVTACGDHDGDGLNELLVSAPWDSSGASLAGRVHLIDGDEPDTLAREVLSGQLRHTWTASIEGARLGQATLCDVDVDGDGLVELILGAPFADVAGRDASGAVYVLLGGVDKPDGDVADVSAFALTGPGTGGWFGAALASGDLSGDGVPELIVGAPGRDSTRGALYLYDGARLRSGDTKPRTVIFGPPTRARFGASLTVLDLDGDGLLDLIAGAPRLASDDTPDGFESGALYVFKGSVDLEAWPSAGTVDDADESLASDALLTRLGARVAGGDLDGDGAAELVWALDVQPI
ncbi:MAG: FG-GAP repeat protein [Alphaproteobacteria bacterium]|nr:FG-GAP repeat protein [Alphaproteobacteria bacterium]